MALTEPLSPATSPLEDATLRASSFRKASLRLIPLLALGYCAAYIDRVNISFAALQMNRDLHFSATIYGFGAGLFFLSYAACEVPSNLLLVRFGARRWLARIMFTWGILAIGMMFVRTPVHFYVMRFLLGMAEAGFFPGVIFYLGQWFPAATRARAVSRFYISMPLSSVVMGVLAGALLKLQGTLGLAGWQWLFLVEGLPPLLLGVAFLLLLPDGPADAPWLTSAERTGLLNQLHHDSSSPGHHESIAPALRDRRVWLLSLLFFCVLTCNYAYTFSAPAILQAATSLGSSAVGFLIAAIGLLGALAMLLNAMHSDRSGERTWHIAAPCLLMAASFAVAGVAHAALIVVPALALSAIAFFALQGPVWAIPATFLKGRSAAAGIAVINMVAILGGFAGPYWMGRARDLTGNYQRGLLTLAIPAVASAAVILFMSRTRTASTN